MANFTKRAIKASFLKLLNEQPLNKISVRDIVEDCGINRNSFYYHYQDIPALLGEIITEWFAGLTALYPTVSSIGACFAAAAEYSLQNKKALLHIYNSLNRDTFETYLMQFCECAVSTYMDVAFSQQLPACDRATLIRFVKCELFGAYLEWLRAGLPEEAVEELERMLNLCHGLTSEMLRRTQAESGGA